MAFKSNQYQNISVCQTCKGYGVINPNDPISQHKDCPNCTRDGVYIQKGNEVFMFGMPTFVDYRNRKMQVIARYMLVFFIFALIITLFVVFI